MNERVSSLLFTTIERILIHYLATGIPGPEEPEFVPQSEIPEVQVITQETSPQPPMTNGEQISNSTQTESSTRTQQRAISNRIVIPTRLLNEQSNPTQKLTPIHSDSKSIAIDKTFFAFGLPPKTYPLNFVDLAPC